MIDKQPDQVLEVGNNGQILLQPRGSFAPWKIVPGSPTTQIKAQLKSKPPALTLTTWNKPQASLPFLGDPSQPKSIDALPPLKDGIY